MNVPDNLLYYIGIASIFGIIKAKLKNTSSKLAWCFSVFISISFAVIVGFVVEEFRLPQGIVFACVAAAALTAESIAAIIMGVGEAAKEDPLGTLKKLRGKD